MSATPFATTTLLRPSAWWSQATKVRLSLTPHQILSEHIEEFKERVGKWAEGECEAEEGPFVPLALKSGLEEDLTGLRTVGYGIDALPAQFCVPSQ